jgi:hypothetical protein
MLIRSLGGSFHSNAMSASTSLMVPVEHLTRVQGVNQMLNGGLLVGSFMGTYSLFTPWSVTAVLPAIALQTPLPLPTWLPLCTTAALTLLCVAVALWRFRSMEF